MQVYEFITDTLTEALEPSYLHVDDESHQHNVADGAQSHFKVTVVSEAFAGKRLIARHRLCNELLNAALEGPVHALSLHTFTGAEWQQRNGNVAESPKCLGGSKFDR